MRGRLIACRVWLVGLAALVALPCATAVASGSSVAQTASPAVGYGPLRDWAGMQARVMDCPVAPLSVPQGCPPNVGPGPSTGSDGSGGPGANPAPAKKVPRDQILSNEKTFTRWAYVRRIANVYWQPTTTSRSFSKLTWYTEDGFNSVYLLLRAHWTKQGQEWIKIRVPGRPNGRIGWIERDALGAFHLTHNSVVVNTERMQLTFYVHGRAIWSAPVGVGAPSMPTPHGRFWINERFILTDPSNGYFPYAFGTTDYSTLTDWPGGGVVGIHGPYGAPASAIPGRISHGCIRLRIPDDFWLGRHMKLGTPVRVV